MNIFNRLILTAALVAASHATLASPPSQNTDGDGPKKLVIHYADLDLTAANGPEKLFHRIQRAAKMVCSPLESRYLAQNVKYRECVADAMSRAVTQVDRPALSAYYKGTVRGSHDTTPIEIASRNAGPAN